MPTSRSSRQRRPRRITEFELIRRLQQMLPIPASRTSAIIAGIGDDAAIVRPRPGHVLLATTDLLAEQVHFDLSYMTYRQVGYRAAVANLSDMAAMGATPCYALITLACGPRTTATDVLALYRGIAEACRATRTAVIGGDTSASRADVFVNITVLGEARPRQILRRSGARRGDLLYVTGTLGDARAGLELLRTRTRTRSGLPTRWMRHLINRHIAPMARLTEGRALAVAGLASAAIDVSDGLAGDVRHICEESSVGALLDLRRLPLSSALRAFARAPRRNAFAFALSGGEDYELLFTVPKSKTGRVNALIRHGRLCATAIGTITSPRQGLRMMTVEGRIRPLPAHGYEHRIGGRHGTL